MANLLQDKVAFITRGNVSIGKAATVRMTKAGAKVIITALLCLTFSLFQGTTAQDSSSSDVSAVDTRTNSGIYHFNIGNFKATVVSDGTLTIPVNFFVPKAEPEAVEAVLAEHFLSTENLSAHINTLYLETSEHRVLIDTGAGSLLGSSAGHLLENLEADGIAVDTIDTVIVTHAHSDHIGGILNNTGQVQIPNAQFYISQPEANFWLADTVEMPNSLLDKEGQAELVDAAQGRLNAVRDRTTLFAMGEEVIPGITAVSSVGHTPGQTSFLITSREDSLLFTGDVFYSDPLNLENPDWEVVFDDNPTQATEARHELLETVTADRRLLLVPHMPFPGLGHVRVENNAYGWEPILWQFSLEE